MSTHPGKRKSVPPFMQAGTGSDTDHQDARSRPYRGLLVDATILATINEGAGHITDENVRHAMQSGVAASMKSVQAQAGEDFSLSLEVPREG